MATALDIAKIKINLFKTFACTDATSFSGMIADGYKPIVPTKEQDQINSKGLIASMPEVTTGLYKLSKVLAQGKKFLDGEVGACTTLALAGVYVLLDGKEANLAKFGRIEIVTLTNHVFLIVNREGAPVPPTKKGVKFTSGIVPAHGTWGTKAFVFDPWLVTLGHPGLDAKPTSGPKVMKDGYSNLQLKFDSQIESCLE